MKTAMTSLVAALCLGLGLAAAAAPAPGQAADTLRAEVGKPLQAAQDLLKAGRHKEALAKVREADAVADLSPYERFVVDRMRGSAALGAGDDATAARSFDAVLASGRLQPAEALPILESLAGSAYRAKDYARAIGLAQRYFEQGGKSEQMRNLKTGAHYLSGDFAGVVKEMQQKVLAVEQSVPVVDEGTLRMLAASYAKLGDDAGYVATLEKLLVHHPSRTYWLDRLGRLENDPAFSDRYQLDLYRLRQATGTLDDANQYAEMAQLALQAGLPAEARRVVEAGYAAGKLGTGAEAERHQRLRALAHKQAAEDEKFLGEEVVGRTGDALVNAGQSLVSWGQADKGIELIERGIAKGGLKRPDQVQLRLGQACLLAGRKAKALDALRAVRGADGGAELARLWAIQAGRP